MRAILPELLLFSAACVVAVLAAFNLPSIFPSEKRWAQHLRGFFGLLILVSLIIGGYLMIEWVQNQ